jgi:dephospho-CoA kinase
MILGISGYTGSGKSAVAEYLSQKYDFLLIDADKTARKIMLENSDLIDEIDKIFDVVHDKKIDFLALGNIVFESVETLKKLNSITFPYIIYEIKSEIKNSSRSCVLDAALLPLISPKDICNSAIWVESDFQIRIDRLRERTNLSVDVIKNRIAKQVQLMSKPTKDKFWNFIENNSSLENLFSEIDEKINPCF